MISQVAFVLLLSTLRTSLTSTVAGRQHVEPDPDLENYLREAIENFREQMRKGIPAINMPVLDPLELRNLDINVEENLATMDLRIRRLAVSNLSLFNITHLKPNLEELYIGINMTLPLLNVHGKYEVDGRFVKILPIFGKGDLDVNATGVEISGVGQLGFAADTLQMSLLKLDLSWHNLSVYMENFLGGGSFSEVLQRVVPGVGKDVFQNYKPLIMENLETFLTCKINDKLEEPAVKDIIKSILPKHFS